MSLLWFAIVIYNAKHYTRSGCIFTFFKNFLAMIVVMSTNNKLHVYRLYHGELIGIICEKVANYDNGIIFCLVQHVLKRCER